MLFKKASETHSCDAIPAPPDRIRQAIINQAIREQADAILIEPTVDGLRIRYRITGQWNATMNIPTHLQSALTASLRASAGLTTPNSTPQQTVMRMGLTETRSTPGASSFEIGLVLFEYEGVEYDIYIAFLPTRLGERMALRLLPQSDPPAAFTPLELLQL